MATAVCSSVDDARDERCAQTRDSQRSIVADDPRSITLLALAERVAAADVTVMLTGDSGVGKEVYARYIHAHSNRASGPFVALNCAAIPETMLEAVMFGHEKGAYTGATEARMGKFEQADSGTLLLDEVTEMALSLQAKLLRVLQEREVERLGSTRARPIDVRVIATSNRDLKQAVADGLLREDLYYRLNVFPLALPPLRERPGDILPLAYRLARRHAAADAVPPVFTAAAEQALVAHTWPGNVRELENVVQRALVLAGGDTIDVDSILIEGDTAFPVAEPPRVELAPDAPASALDADLRSHEGELILRALRAESGRRNRAAARLGISPRTLRYKLARLRELGVALP